MAIGAMTRGAESKTHPQFMEMISFAGDGAYPTGGTAAFEDAVQAKVGDARTVVGVVGQDCGGYSVAYDRANDKLKVFETNADGGGKQPQTEVANAVNLAGTTFNVLVISQ